MTDIYRVGWPVPNTGIGQAATVHTNTAECVTKEAAKQVRDALRRGGFAQAEMFAATATTPEEQVVLVRRYANLLLDSCFIPNRDVAQDFLDLLDAKAVV